MKIHHALTALLCLIACSITAVPAQAQTATPKLEYAFTYKALIDPAYGIDNALVVVSVLPGGWVKGPKISGTFVPPGGDWITVLPSGALKLDARATIKTDDGDLLYMTYEGVLQHTEESFKKATSGEVVKAGDVAYFIAAPIIRTASKKYDYLNRIQFINKFVEMQFGPNGSYVIYDVFAVK